MANHEWASGEAEADGAGPDFESERWQARLGRLETRLEMLETQLKSEIDRIELAAQSIDSVTDEFRTTVGGVRNMVDLANDIGDRVSILTALEKRLSGQHDAVASAVAEQLERELADRKTRDTSIEQELARLHGALRPLEHRIDALTGTIDRLHAEQPDVETLTGPLHERIDALTTALDELRIAQPDIGPQLQALAATLGEVRSAATAGPAVDGVGLGFGATDGRLDALEAAITAANEHVTLAEVAAAEHANTISTKLEGLPGLRDELQATREEMRDIKTAMGDVLDELDRLDQAAASRLPGSAVLTPATAPDVAWLEDRLDTEFDAVGYQVEALAVLLGEAIEAMHRIESQIVGPQPTTDRMREAAASVVASLRANVRQRTLDRAWTEPEPEPEPEPASEAGEASESQRPVEG